MSRRLLCIIFLTCGDFDGGGCGDVNNNLIDVIKNASAVAKDDYSCLFLV